MREDLHFGAELGAGLCKDTTACHLQSTSIQQISGMESQRADHKLLNLHVWQHLYWDLVAAPL
jgi:hypothetical protein